MPLLISCMLIFTSGLLRANLYYIVVGILMGLPLAAYMSKAEKAYRFFAILDENFGIHAIVLGILVISIVIFNNTYKEWKENE